jgi:hypothetical protein
MVKVVKKYNKNGNLEMEWFENKNGIKDGISKHYRYGNNGDNDNILYETTIIDFKNGKKNGLSFSYSGSDFKKINNVTLYKDDDVIYDVKWDIHYYTGYYELDIHSECSDGVDIDVSIEHKSDNYSKIDCLNNIIDILQNVKSMM